MRPLPRTLAFRFALAGFVLAEIYMLATALGPNLKGSAVPGDVAVMRVLVLALFFGPFGAAAGTGVGLLVGGLLSAVRKRKSRRAADAPH